jgi:hypothetical protein
MPGNVTTAVESGERVESPRAKTAKAPAGAWLLPSFTDLAMLIPVILLFARLKGLSSLVTDASTCWQIRTGQWILEHGRVPTHDIFSFTMNGRSWFAWEWLWDVTFGWLHLRGGLTAVALASLAVIAATYGLLYRLVRLKCENMLIAIAATTLATMIGTVHWLARPHLFTILFLAVFLLLLERARAGRIRGLLILPVAMALWANLHGGFVAGLMVVLTYAAGEAAGGLAKAEPEAWREGLRRSKPYLLAASGCMLASLANPQFYKLHVHIFQFLSDEYQHPRMMEFLPVNFLESVARYFEPMLALAFVAAAWSVWKGRWTQVFLIVCWAHLALFSRRNLPLFAVVAAPVIAGTLEEFAALALESRGAAWIRKSARCLAELGREYLAMDGAGRFPVAGTAALALVFALSYMPGSTPLLRAEFDPQKFPQAAAESLRAEDRIFTTDQWGAYLIYRFYPNQKVFIDDRSDFYGAEFCSRYLTIVNVRYDWERSLKRYGVDTVLLPVDAALAGTLKESARWRPVYDDGVAILFRLKDKQISAGIVGGSFPWSPDHENSGWVILRSPDTLMRGDA